MSDTPLDDVQFELNLAIEFRDYDRAERMERIKSALQVCAGSRATIERLTKTNEPEEDDEHFLVAHVSKDTKVIGIDHPTGASFEDVLAAHIALRDRLNVRIEEQDNCPFSASVGKS